MSYLEDYAYSSEQIKAMREAMGLKSEEFANLMGYSRQAYSKLENGLFKNEKSSLHSRVVATLIINHYKELEPYKTNIRKYKEDKKKAIILMNENLTMLEDI